MSLDCSMAFEIIFSNKIQYCSRFKDLCYILAQVEIVNKNDIFNIYKWTLYINILFLYNIWIYYIYIIFEYIIFIYYKVELNEIFTVHYFSKTEDIVW